MKTNKKRLANYLKIGILLFGISILLWNCEKDETINKLLQESKVPVKQVEHTTFSGFLKDPIFSKFNEQHNLSIYRNMYRQKNATNGFTIKEQVANKVAYGNSISYNFYIERNNSKSNVVENLVVLKTKKITTAFIVKYTYKNIQARGGSIHQELDQVEVNPIDSNTNYNLNDFIKQHYEGGSGGECKTFFLIETFSCSSSKRHSYENRASCECGTDGNSCRPPRKREVSIRVCEPKEQNYIDTDSDVSSSGVGSSGLSNGTDAYIVVGEEDGVTVITRPDEFPYSDAVLTLIDVLNISDLNTIAYLQENTESMSSKIVDFLDANKDTTGNHTTQAKIFAKEAIKALMDGAVVDFDDAYIETETPDDNYVYQAATQLINNPLTLSNGDKVNITFGTTKSDGKNANQKVSPDLIDGIKFAIEKANSNLSASDKITSIHISATTNGKHSSTSNHSKGTAVDISRINGVKMIISGLTNQIKELQNGFDNYSYIRENFGPYFKHKYSKEKSTGNQWNYNHPVGGHKDHIHVSVRK